MATIRIGLPLLIMELILANGLSQLFLLLLPIIRVDVIELLPIREQLWLMRTHLTNWVCPYCYYINSANSILALEPTILFLHTLDSHQ